MRALLLLLDGLCRLVSAMFGSILYKPRSKRTRRNHSNLIMMYIEAGNSQWTADIYDSPLLPAVDRKNRTPYCDMH